MSGFVASGRSGYCVSTVGLDERRVRQYIREQESWRLAKVSWTSVTINGLNGAFFT